MVWIISYHVPRVDTNKYAPINVVFQCGYIDTESTNQYSGLSKIEGSIISNVGNTLYENSIHFRLNIFWLRYNQVHFMESSFDYHVLHTLINNWYEYLCS